MSHEIIFPEIELNTINDIQKFVNLSKTDFADYYYRIAKDEIKVIGKEQDIYYYDNIKRLWLCASNEVYVASFAKYCNNIAHKLKTNYTNLTDAMSKIELKDLTLTQKEINEKCKDLDSTSYLKAIVDRSTGFLQNNEFAKLLNSNPDYLPIKNGNKICLRDGNISMREKTDFFSFECNVEKVEETPNAEKFFRQVMPKKVNREYLRDCLGYMLTGNMDARCFFIWYGFGSNGKTVTMNLLKSILKGLYHQTSKGIFMKGSNEKVEGASPDKMALMGVRCGTYSEGETADDIDINESFLKMVSGKDEINARALFRAPVTFYPVCKLNLLTNYKPDLNGDPSLRKRVHYLFLDSLFDDNPDETIRNQFKKDDDFVDKLNNEYLSEVFSWILEGSINYYKTKELKKPKEFIDRTNEFFEQQDSITAFENNRINITHNDKDYVNKAEIFRIYQKYCDANSIRCKPRSTLFKRLEDLQLRLTCLNGNAIYRGITIIDEQFTEENEEEKKEDKAVYIRAEEHKSILNELDNIQYKFENINEENLMLKDEIKRINDYVQYLENYKKRISQKSIETQTMIEKEFEPEIEAETDKEDDSDTISIVKAEIVQNILDVLNN